MTEVCHFPPAASRLDVIIRYLDAIGALMTSWALKASTFVMVAMMAASGCALTPMQLRTSAGLMDSSDVLSQAKRSPAHANAALVGVLGGSWPRCSPELVGKLLAMGADIKTKIPTTYRECRCNKPRVCRIAKAFAAGRRRIVNGRHMCTSFRSVFWRAMAACATPKMVKALIPHAGPDELAGMLKRVISAIPGQGGGCGAPYAAAVTAAGPNIIFYPEGDGVSPSRQAMIACRGKRGHRTANTKRIIWASQASGCKPTAVCRRGRANGKLANNFAALSDVARMRGLLKELTPRPALGGPTVAIEAVRLLLAAKAKPRGDVFADLRYAKRSDRARVLDLLLRHGIGGKNMSQTLDIALRDSKMEFARALVGGGIVHQNAKIAALLKAGDFKTAQWLRNAIYRPRTTPYAVKEYDKPPLKALFRAVRRGDTKRLALLFDAGVSRRHTRRGKSLVYALIEAASTASFYASTKRSTLHLRRRGRLPIKIDRIIPTLQLLLNRGASAEACYKNLPVRGGCATARRSKCNSTPLHKAISIVQSLPNVGRKLIEMLITAGAKPTVPDLGALTAYDLVGGWPTNRPHRAELLALLSKAGGRATDLKIIEARREQHRQDASTRKDCYAQTRRFRKRAEQRKAEEKRQQKARRESNRRLAELKQRQRESRAQAEGNRRERARANMWKGVAKAVGKFANDTKQTMAQTNQALSNARAQAQAQRYAQQQQALNQQAQKVRAQQHSADHARQQREARQQAERQRRQEQRRQRVERERQRRERVERERAEKQKREKARLAKAAPKEFTVPTYSDFERYGDGKFIWRSRSAAMSQARYGATNRATEKCLQRNGRLVRKGPFDPPAYCYFQCEQRKTNKSEWRCRAVVQRCVARCTSTKRR